MHNPFRYFNSSPEVIRLAVMMYIRYPLSLRQVEDLLFERGIDICHETVRFWWNRFGPMFAAEIRKRRVHHRLYSQWRWHLDDVFVKINGETHYLWRAVDHEGEVLEVFATKRRDRRAVLKFLKRTMKRYGRPRKIVPHCAGVPFCIGVAPFAESAAVTSVPLKHHYLANVATIIEEAHPDDPVVAAVAGPIASKVFA
jgi:transposase-like protein